MRWTLLLLTALFLATPALAQPGPAPGYATAVDYAADYAGSKAEDAGSDPVSFTENMTAPGAVDEEVRHAAYVSCWAADDAGIESDVCDDYYTPRGEENDDQDCECNVSSDDAQAFANETADATGTYAGNATDFVNQTAEDPANATSHAAGFLATTQAFAEATADRAVDFVLGLVDDLSTCLGLGIAVGQSFMGGIGAAAGLLADVVGSGAKAMAGLAISLGDGITLGISSVGGLLADVGIAVGSGLASAGEATGEAFQQLGSAIADAAISLKDAVTGLFGSDDASSTAKDTVGGAVDGVAGKDGLLDGVTGILPS